MLKAIHAQEDRTAARQKAEQVAVNLKEMKLADAATLLLAGIEETLYYYTFPREHCKRPVLLSITHKLASWLAE